jgi:hypothetical protein
MEKLSLFRIGKIKGKFPLLEVLSVLPLQDVLLLLHQI